VTFVLSGAVQVVKSPRRQPKPSTKLRRALILVVYDYGCKMFCEKKHSQKRNSRRALLRVYYLCSAKFE